MDRRPLKQMSELCANSGVGIVAYGVLLGGMLADPFVAAPVRISPIPYFANSAFRQFHMSPIPYFHLLLICLFHADIHKINDLRTSDRMSLEVI